jgi:hypothetical protein
MAKPAPSGMEWLNGLISLRNVTFVIVVNRSPEQYDNTKEK